MKNKIKFFKSLTAKISTAVAVSVISGLIVVRVNGCFTPKSLSTPEIREKIFAALEKYADDLNKHSFDAYKYFAPKVELFFKMPDTTPKAINDNVSANYYKNFLNASFYFDKSTLIIKEISGNEYCVSIISHAKCYNLIEKKQYDDFRARAEIKFDSDFRIKYLRQFYD